MSAVDILRRLREQLASRDESRADRKARQRALDRYLKDGRALGRRVDLFGELDKLPKKLRTLVEDEQTRGTVPNRSERRRSGRRGQASRRHLMVGGLRREERRLERIRDDVEQPKASSYRPAHERRVERDEQVRLRVRDRLQGRQMQLAIDAECAANAYADLAKRRAKLEAARAGKRAANLTRRNERKAAGLSRTGRRKPLARVAEPPSPAGLIAGGSSAGDGSKAERGAA